jgi:hypothetical protein
MGTFLEKAAQATARVFQAAATDPGEWLVAVANDPVNANPTAILASKSLNAMLTHERGVKWPNAAGEAVGVAALDRGGTVVMTFETLPDALACKQKIDRAAA